MAKRLKASLITLLMLFEFLKIKNMVHFMVRNTLRKQLLISIKDNMALSYIKMMKCAYFMVLKMV
ncbi:Uncharacterised protein [Mycobacteroides abscessus subsp. abscessus]|nr:Uncharacterised protein [Mycobacteroides abscessus subsp. abscessus]